MGTTKTKKKTAAPKEPKGTVGRPSSGLPKRYQVRHTDDQMAQWLKAAEAEGRDLQNWAQHTLNRAAEKAIEKAG